MCYLTPTFLQRHQVVHFDDAQIKRLGEMCFRDQFAEAVKMDKVLGSALGLQIQEIANNRGENLNYNYDF